MAKACAGFCRQCFHWRKNAARSCIYTGYRVVPKCERPWDDTPTGWLKK